MGESRLVRIAADSLIYALRGPDMEQYRQGIAVVVVPAILAELREQVEAYCVDLLHVDDDSVQAEHAAYDRVLGLLATGGSDA